MTTTSAPEAVGYFVDYEIHDGGRYRRWGNTTLVWHPATDATQEPARLLDAIREQAGREFGVAAIYVRVRHIARL